MTAKVITKLQLELVAPCQGLGKAWWIPQAIFLILFVLVSGRTRTQ